MKPATGMESEKSDAPKANLLGLDEDELDCLSRQLDMPKSDSGYLQIFRYANTVDGLVMGLSAVAAVGAGATMPLMTVILGSLVGNFSDLASTTNSGAFAHNVNHLVLYFVYIAVGTLVLTSLFVFGFTWTGERITKRLRSAYFEALLRQNMAFLDALGAGEAASRITADLNVIQDGVSQKVGLAVSGLAAFAAGMVVAYVRSWRLALVMTSLPVAVTAWMIVVGTSMKKAQLTSTDLYSSTATFAEEAISSLRNVAAYGLQKRFVEMYEASLAPAARADARAKAMMGLFIGGLMGAMLSAFALACWAGSRFMDAGDVDTSQVVTVLFASMIAGVSFGQVAPHLQAFGAAGAAANRIFGAIERRPPAGVASDKATGLRPDKLLGHIQFCDVKLVYPSRPDQLVMDGFTLDVPAGKTTAIVGPSGTGKSSLIYLLQRFYLPLRGRVCIDGHDIEDIDVQWIRSNMRVVNQEPFVFNTTILENIAFGLVGTRLEKADSNTKQTMAEQAARAANAHDFISQLPHGYQTVVGENGGRLSGGQRQRVAIARALISDPRILLLDEATAALDAKSESLVQTSLSTRGPGRTTIVISHRLSTVRGADNIVVMDHGRVIEQGTHEQLLVSQGAYSSLVEAQALREGADSPREMGYGSDDEQHGSSGKALEKSRVAAWGREQRQESTRATTLALVKFLLHLNHPERMHLLAGMIGSAFAGLGYPLTAIFFGNMVLALRDPRMTLGGHGIGFWAGMQWLTAWVVLFGYVGQGTAFAHASSRLIARARAVAFAAILRQDAAFFTRPGNDPGALTAFLSQQASQLNGLSGTILGALLNSIVAVVGGFIVATSFGWKLGLVATATMPLIFTTGYARFRVLADLEKKSLRDSKAAAVVSEAVRGIRTIAALGLEDTIAERYRLQLGDDIRSSAGQNALLSVLYGTSQSVIIFCTALIFWYGGSKLLPTGEYTVQSFLICFVATTYSAQSAGGIFSHAPDVAGAQDAAIRLKTLTETVPQIDVDSEDGDNAEALVGDVAACNVDFAYPSPEGPGHLVLRDVSLKAKTGSFVALVGASGSGKSSVLNLVERLYDPCSGQIVADAKDIRQYRLQSFRKQMAIVEQDSVLYSGTIRDNIISDGDFDDGDIEKACRDANIWDFVSSLPNGLDTAIGPRGTQASGGQKQRLALARALLRKPKILLLDEATSALDAHSEAVVQEALAAAAMGRTTIAVAHRISSIANADCIYVFDQGTVVEQGTHAQLIARKGRYWDYVGMQTLETT
ncbi:GTPase-activating protein [Purpureocillium lilacinum]|nr:GTPase-activating protein [Purpureocillium lilacinum]